MGRDRMDDSIRRDRRAYKAAAARMVKRVGIVSMITSGADSIQRGDPAGTKFPDWE
jgi:hypothetical protein